MSKKPLVVIDEIPPQVLDLEQAVLGCMILHPDCIPEVAAITSPYAFYRDAHRVIFDTMLDLYKEGKAVDVVILTAKLRDRELLDLCGGIVYLFTLTEKVGTWTNYATYAQGVQETNIRRQIITRSIDTIEAAYEDEGLERIAGGNGHYNLTELALKAPQFNQVSNNKFSLQEIAAVNITEEEPPTPLYYGIYPGKVTFLIGETGAGKSSWLYNVAIHAARNEPLFGIPFSLGRPLRVGYLDPENAGGLCAAKLARIGAGKPKDLIFNAAQEVNLSKVTDFTALKQWVLSNKFDLLILDPLINLYQTKDENDNAEAGEQMKSLNALSRSTGAAIIACHHTGRDTGNNFGRGATARLSGSDVGIVLRVKSSDGEEDDSFEGEKKERRDICRLQIHKDRPGALGRSSLYLRMAGEDKFTRATFSDWVGTGGQGVPVTAKLRHLILEMLADGGQHSRAEIIDAAKQEKLGEKNTDYILSEMRIEGKIQHRKGLRGLDLYWVERTDTE